MKITMLFTIDWVRYLFVTIIIIVAELVKSGSIDALEYSRGNNWKILQVTLIQI